MNRLNFYLALLALLTAVSVLDYIPANFKDYVKLIFFITSSGFLLKMMTENFEFTYKKIKDIIIKIESNVFFVITCLMIAFVFASLVSWFIKKINLNGIYINEYVMYALSGVIGALFGKVVKKKDDTII